MKIELSPVQKEEKEILRNLLEKYLYEFSQYDENNDIYLNESNDYWVYLSVSKYHE